MQEMEKSFEIASDGETLTVSEHSIKNQRIFRVIFPGNEKPLVLTVATDSSGHRFWTSIPEGRQDEASKIGPLIAHHFINK